MYCRNPYYSTPVLVTQYYFCHIGIPTIGRPSTKMPTADFRRYCAGYTPLKAVIRHRVRSRKTQALRDSTRLLLYYITFAGESFIPQSGLRWQYTSRPAVRVPIRHLNLHFLHTHAPDDYVLRICECKLPRRGLNYIFGSLLCRSKTNSYQYFSVSAYVRNYRRENSLP